MCRSDEVVARLGGAEFAILQGDAQPHQMSGTGERILRLLSGPVELSSGRVFVTASVGLTHCRDANADPGEIMRQADLAVDRAETDGGGRACFFEPEMDMALRARKSLEHDLREALANESFTMVYQPQANLRGVVTGVEALIRWSHPVRGPVSPAFFIPVAEECGLIEEIGAYTLRQAFRDSRRWPQMTVAVNVSAAQLRNPQFPDLVGRMLAEADVRAEQFELEITEGVLLADDDSTHDTLHKLRAMGFRLALDDFGTGYSSLGYLRRYPVDKIKIDRSFVVNLGIERDAEAVVGAIVKLARALNLKVIAEGVETEEQQMGLERAGCRHIQGYLFSRPLTAELVDHLVRARVTS